MYDFRLHDLRFPIGLEIVDLGIALNRKSYFQSQIVNHVIGNRNSTPPPVPPPTLLPHTLPRSDPENSGFAHLCALLPAASNRAYG